MIKFSDGQTVETLSVSKSDGDWDGTVRNIAVIITTGLDVAQAVKLFTDGAVWSTVEDGVEDKSWNTYTKAGSITDNRDGTLVVKMAEEQSVESQLDETLRIILGEEI